MLRLPGIEYVEADEVRRRPFRAAVAPLPSLQGTLVDAAGGGRKGTPAEWRRAIRAELRERDYDTLSPFAASGQTLVPDALLGLPEPPSESLKDGIERMIATPDDELLAEAELCRQTTGNLAWLQLERDPARWLRRYVGSLLRAWKGFAPLWRRAREALDREVERIGTATALDAQLELLDGLLTQAAVEDGRWCLRCKFAEGQRRFPDTGLVLLPLVAGDGGSILDVGETTIRRVGYPVPGVHRLRAAEPAAPSLEALLGIPRAQILRTLEHPTSIGRLADALRAVPSAATHHVGALEGTGLVTRERSGRRVLVRRTSLGDALLELYASHASRTPKAAPSRSLSSAESAPLRLATLK